MTAKVFIRYTEQTAEQLEEAKVISEACRTYWENRQYEVIQSKLAFRFNPTTPHEFQQQEAFAAGQLSIINEFLNNTGV